MRKIFTAIKQSFWTWGISKLPKAQTGVWHQRISLLFFFFGWGLKNPVELRHLWIPILNLESMFFSTPHPIRELFPNFYTYLFWWIPQWSFRFATIFPLKVTKKQASVEFTQTSVTCFKMHDLPMPYVWNKNNKIDCLLLGVNFYLYFKWFTASR